MPPPGPDSSTLLAGDEGPAERKIRAALDQPTQIEFVDTPLKDVVDYLKKWHHIEIQLDLPALKEAGVGESTRMTRNLKGISLGSALKLLLDELQLKYVIHNEVLLITTREKAESDEYMADQGLSGGGPGHPAWLCICELHAIGGHAHQYGGDQDVGGPCRRPR